MHVMGINNRISFERRPKREEEAELKAAINKAYNAMGTTDRIVITHGSCFPALGRDSYIGSPVGSAAREYIRFLQLYGFNGNQLGPCGKLENHKDGINTSPYNSSAFAKNRLFIDLGLLTNNKYGKILSRESYYNVTQKPEITDKDYDMTDFNEAEKVYNDALKESYQNFKVNLAKGQPEAIKLNHEYEKFLSKYNIRLTDEGIFKVLARRYGTDNFDNWDNDLDKHLIPETKAGNRDAAQRYHNIISSNKNEIEQYKFEQFLITKQMKDNKDWRDKRNFKYFNDLLVGCSKMDEWRYEDAFLDDYSLGAMGGYGKHQVWNIPVIDPRKIFNGPDMELNTGGRFLKEKIDYALEFCENIRIDHALGLVEPFLIKKDSIHYDKDGKINYSKLDASYMSQTYENGGKLDDFYNYPRIIEHIVIPALKEHGLKPDDAVWEDLCSNPPLFRDIYYNKLHLPKLIQLEWGKSEHAGRDNWFLVGSHDSIPAQNMIKRDWTRNNDAWNPLYLAGYLNQDPKRVNESKKMCELIASNINGKEKQGKELDIADKEMVKAKFAELLTNKKFQITFADLLGITDMTYNIGGSKHNDNWKERITPDYLDKYYKNLSSKYPTAINIPEVLKMALQAKIDMKVIQSENKDATRALLYKYYQPLLDDLQKYADILKEPE